MIAAERRRLEKLRSRTTKATIGNAHVETVRGCRCRALLLPRCVGATLCSSPHTTRNRRRCRTVPCHAVPCCAVLPATPRALPHRHAACGACHASRHEHVVCSAVLLCAMPLSLDPVRRWCGLVSYRCDSGRRRWRTHRPRTASFGAVHAHRGPDAFVSVRCSIDCGYFIRVAFVLCPSPLLRNNVTPFVLSLCCVQPKRRTGTNDTGPAGTTW